MWRETVLVHVLLQVKLRPVLWGLGLQFLFGVITLRTPVGYDAFHFVGRNIHGFMNYANNGSAFVFGRDYEEHLFAFKVTKHKQAMSILNQHIGFLTGASSGGLLQRSHLCALLLRHHAVGGCSDCLVAAG